MAYCIAPQKLHHLHHNEFVRASSVLMNITVFIPGKFLNLLVKRAEENSVLSVFSLSQLLKKIQRSNSIYKV